MTSQLYKILLPKSNIGQIRLGEEQRVCIEFANYLRQLSLEKSFPYVWFHVPNEYARHLVMVGNKKSWRNSAGFGVRQAHMGRIPGTPDFSFSGKGKTFFIEFKTGKGKQTESQLIFEEWCKDCEVDYFVCRSFDEAKEVIEKVIKEFSDIKIIMNNRSRFTGGWR